MLERLENQLIKQYLRAYNSRYGIYLIGIIHPRDYWQGLREGERITFEELVGVVTDRAGELLRSHSNVNDLEVISINFCEPRRN